ncbi:MAG: hypothetical protein AB1898_04815 [Acidobacteriota bacterium]
MNQEALIEQIVRRVLHRLEEEGSLLPSAPQPDLPVPAASGLDDLYRQYRERYAHPCPSQERLVPVPQPNESLHEWIHPSTCIYEVHRPCDDCGRCQMRGF